MKLGVMTCVTDEQVQVTWFETGEQWWFRKQWSKTSRVGDMVVTTDREIHHYVEYLRGEVVGHGRFIWIKNRHISVEIRRGHFKEIPQIGSIVHFKYNRGDWVPVEDWTAERILEVASRVLRGKCRFEIRNHTDGEFEVKLQVSRNLWEHVATGYGKTIQDGLNDLMIDWRPNDVCKVA